VTNLFESLGMRYGGAPRSAEINCVWELTQGAKSGKLGSAQICGCSSVVERNLAKVDVVGSNPITRFLEEAPESLDSGAFLVAIGGLE
jgi:hypothetical protein